MARAAKQPPSLMARRSLARCAGVGVADDALTFDSDNRASLVACVARAREGATTVRQRPHAVGPVLGAVLDLQARQGALGAVPGTDRPNDAARRGRRSRASAASAPTSSS